MIIPKLYFSQSHDFVFLQSCMHITANIQVVTNVKIPITKTIKQRLISAAKSVIPLYNSPA